MCSRSGLKVNVNKGEVMMLDGEKGLECEICVDRTQLEQMGRVLDEIDTDDRVL